MSKSKAKENLEEKDIKKNQKAKDAKKNSEGKATKKKLKMIIIIVVIVILLSIALAFGIIKIAQNMSNGEKEKIFSYNEETRTYELETKEIEIKNNDDLSLDVNTSIYTWPLTVVNKEDCEYKKAIVKFEFYDENEKCVKELTETVENLKPKEERDINITFDDLSLIVYSYKAVNVKLEK